MSSRSPRRTSLAVAVAITALMSASPAMAGSGHLLHGVGPVNSSLGGAGTGFPTDVMSALHANPALLAELQKIEVVLSTEIFVDDLSATTQKAGEAPHQTFSDGEPGVLPSFAASFRPGNGKLTLGTALLAVAGFRTNWPTDPASLLLAPQPNGFGDLHTELGVAKIPISLAYKVNDKFSVGASFITYQSRLIINPLPVVKPDCVSQYGSGGTCYRPATKIMTTEYAFAVQLGVYYKLNDKLGLGASYSSKQDYNPFKWSTTHPNPLITSGPQAFSTRWDVEIDLDQPPSFSFGAGYRANDKLLIGADVKWVGYADMTGIGGTGGIGVDGDLISIGWRDIWIGMLGAQYQATEKLQLRAGFNFSQTPIREEVTLNSGGTPAVFEQHYTLGMGYTVTPNFRLELAGYYTPENSVTGPFTGVPGATVTYTNSILSGLFGFSFRF